MPELPEVETIKRGLAKRIIGKRIVGIKVLSEKNFKGNPKEIVGGTVKSVARRAKLLIIKIPNYQLPITNYLLVHLKMTGQLIYKLQIKNEKLKIAIQNAKLTRPKDKRSPYNIDGLPNKYTRVIINFDDGSSLFFNDLRKFGWIKIVSVKCQACLAGRQVTSVKDLDDVIGEKLGPEPFSKEFTVEYLKEILSRWGRPVKLLLMDQKKIAGVGNIYANEALFCAGVAPHHRGRDLVKDHPEKIKKLHDCLLKVLKMGLKYGGSTASDDAFRNIKGERGKMQQHLKVYGRAGQPCPNKCGKKIRRMTLGGRGTFFCPRCQK